MEGLEFGITLHDKMSGPAHDAAKSLHDLKEGSHEAKSALEELKHGFIRTVEPAEVLKDAFKEVGAGVSEMASAMRAGEAGGVIKGFAESLGGLASMLDLVVPGLGQLASAAIKTGGAIAAATAGIIQEATMMSIEATQTKASMISMFGALAGGAEEGAKLEEMLAGLSEQIGITKGAMAPFTKAFLAMGIEGEGALRKVTLAAMSAQAIMGDPAAANAFQNLEKRIQTVVQTGGKLKLPEKGLRTLADMGLRVDDVAKKMGVSSEMLAHQLKLGTVDAKKFGDALQEALIEKGAGPLGKLGLKLDNIKKKLAQDFEDMFEDMGKDVDPLMASIKDFFSIFSQSKPSGQTLKAGIGGAMHFILQTLQSGILPVKHGLLHIGIWSLQTYIVLKKQWTEARPIMAAFGWVVITSAKAMMHLAHGVFTAAQTVGFFIDLIESAYNWLTDTGPAADKGGQAFAKGFADGILGGIPGVISAAVKLGKAAIGGTKDAGEIHSPSRAMFRLGGFSGQGFALGMHSQAPRVAQAGARLSNNAVAGTISARPLGASASMPSPYAPSAGGRGAVGDITINITAPEGVTDARSLTEVAVATLFERLQLQQGLG